MTPSRLTRYRLCAAPTAQILANLREAVFAARRAGCTAESVHDAVITALAYAKLADRITAAGRRTRSTKQPPRLFPVMRCNTPFLFSHAVNPRPTRAVSTAPSTPATPAKKAFEGCTTARRDFDLLEDLTGIDWRPEFVCELTIHQALVEGLAYAVSHAASLRRLIICVGGKIIAAYRVSVTEVISWLGASSQSGALRSYRFGRFFPMGQGIVRFLQTEIKSACGAILRHRFRHGFYSGTMRVVERGKVKFKTAKLTQLPLRPTEDGDSYEIDYSNVRVDFAPATACAYAALAESSSDPFFQTV